MALTPSFCTVPCPPQTCRGGFHIALGWEHQLPLEHARFALNARLHVRHRFLSAADGEPFRVDPSRDADHDVHDARGRTMRLRELAERMIVRSSNLVTNLLVDLLGVEGIETSLRTLGVQGVDFCRGVEDDRAFESGMSNRMTPDGALAAMRAIVGSPLLSPEASTRMIDILLAQQFSGTIAPGLLDNIRLSARVAHETGDISTASQPSTYGDVGGGVPMPDPLASLGLAQYERVVLDAMEARPCGCMVSGDPRRRARLVARRFPPRPIGTAPCCRSMRWSPTSIAGPSAARSLPSVKPGNPPGAGDAKIGDRPGGRA